MRLWLLALCISALLLSTATYAQAPKASQSSSQTEALQSDVSTEAIPRFYAESRQVLVEAKVWNPPAPNGKPDRSAIPRETLDRLGGAASLPNFPTPAKGLTSQNFQVLENGVEQRVNFFHEADFPAIDTTGQWEMHPVFGGSWGFLYTIEITPEALGRPSGTFSWAMATASYILGYTPAPLKPGECRTIQVFVEGKAVDINRSRYCNDKAYDDATGMSKASTVAAQIQQWTTSPTRQSVKLSINSYTFWSSGVLHLLNQVAQEDQSQVLPATDFTYRVEVHGARAPATVQITAQFDLPQTYWEGSECRKHNPGVRVAGVVYTAKGQVAAQFDETYPCLEPTTLASSYLTKYSKHQTVIDRFFKPIRFDTQIELAPGDYELRMAVKDEKNLGTARLPLHVEPFDRNHLAISDVVSAGIARDSSWVLREAASVSPFPVIPNPLVAKDIQFFPDLNAVLRKNTPLTIYFEVYEPALLDQTLTVYYEVRITDLKSGSLALDTGPMSAAKWLIPQSIVVPVGLKIDTGRLKRGYYRLEVKASDSAGMQTGWRQAMFKME